MDPPSLSSIQHPERYISSVISASTNAEFLHRMTNQPNLTHNQRNTLVALCEDHDIMVLPADKLSTTVVLDKADYLQEAYCQLSDPSTYKPTATDLNYTHKQKISYFVTANGPHEGISEMSIKYLPWTIHLHRPFTYYRRSTNKVTRANPL